MFVPVVNQYYERSRTMYKKEKDTLNILYVPTMKPSRTWNTNFGINFELFLDLS